MADVLCAQQIRAYLPKQWQQLCIEVYDTIDSTNAQARRELKEGLHSPKLIVADAQTAGRGRRGRTFYSPKEYGVYMSLVVYPEIDVKAGLRITAATAVAVCRALEPLCKLSLGIKWVNDIYLGEKKVCGILTEGISDVEKGVLSSAVIGIGINLRPQDFPASLSQAAALDNTTVQRNQVVAAVTREVFEAIENLDRAQLIQEYLRRSILIGQEISFEQSGVTAFGKALSIDKDGGLVVQKQDGSVVTLNSGEVTIRKV